MIRAISFDLGGVLFAEGKSVAVEKLARERRYDRDAVLRVLVSPKSVDLRKGLIGDEEFWAWAKQQLPEGYDTQLIRKAWYDGYVLDEDIFRLAQRLKENYKIIAFSGNVRSRVEFLEQKYRFRSLFDIEVYSFDRHHTKPDQEFVRIMIEQSGFRPEEIVYIEDNEPYAQPARELGVKVVIYSRGKIEALVEDLRRLGVVL